MTGSVGLVLIDLADVVEAAERLDGVAQRTPVITCSEIDRTTGAEVFLKAENLQRTGSFKFRGAYNAISALAPSRRAGGVITYSSGNHAQAVARAAELCGTTAVIVMPHDAPPEKVAATESSGGHVIRYDRYTEDRAAIAARLAGEQGRTLIPPYDHPHVMAGQGTVALELLDQVADLDALFVCVGGGGLLAGCATAAAARRPGITIRGVEPLAGDDHVRSMHAGERIEIAVPATIADGQQVSAPGELTWPITSRLTHEFVTVTDDEILGAMVVLFERTKLVVEPSGASALAAVLSGRTDLRGARVGVTISGGNVSLARFTALLSGRSA
ncbi:MAG: pyridoxal-phosphate dependent enzyme [Acidimicrobiia bacterium]|nr:pyridoxal-phosphate dependent enzyme [Acidimicrobiia bacterium]